MARILLIDDEDGTRRTLQLVLENAGHSVAIAADGEEGLALDRDLTFDLVVTDMLMPGRSGSDIILELIRSRPGRHVIAISGLDFGTQTDLLELARGLGAHRTLEKPLLAKTLLAAVSDCLAA